MLLKPNRQKAIKTIENESLLCSKSNTVQDSYFLWWLKNLMAVINSYIVKTYQTNASKLLMVIFLLKVVIQRLYY